MLTLLSPSKTLDFTTPSAVKTHTLPEFVGEAELLIAALRRLTPKKLAKLMEISDKLAAENVARYAAWSSHHTAENAKQAVLAFRGDVYDGLNVDAWKGADFTFAQKHLRILSGLYGLLRPLDLIQPYRLEMGTTLNVGRAKDLYAFWGTSVTDAINEALAEQRATTLVNLASQEYFKVVQAKSINANIVTPVFKEERNGKFTFMSFFGKKARGLMAAYIVGERLKSPEGMKKFDVDGYRYNAALSTDDTWAFTRKS
jgi:cytoplasmic iron level regulating protein YaaA (DUF328/UPF0246 family)